MSLPVASGVGFAIAGGEPTDLGAVLHVQPPTRRGYGRRRLFVTVEPLEPTHRGREVAAAALVALREGFAAAADQPVAAALGRAFANANAAVREENRLRPNDGQERRVFVGATVVVLEGRELVVAQVPPTQAAIVQEGQVYAFPALTSWTSQYAPAFERLGPDAEPLGRSEQTTVDIFRTLAAEGDLVLLCASAIPIAVARDSSSDHVVVPSLSNLQEALRPGDPDRAIDHLDDLIEHLGLDDAHAACFTIGRLHCLDPRVARETAARIGLAWGISRPIANPTMVGRSRGGRSPRRQGRRLQASAVRRDTPDPGQIDLAWLMDRRQERQAPTAPLLRRHSDQVRVTGFESARANRINHAHATWLNGGPWRTLDDGEMLAGGMIPGALPLPMPTPPMPPVPLAEVWDHTATAARNRATACAAQSRQIDTVERADLSERLQIAAMTFTERIAPRRPDRDRGRASRMVPGAQSIQRHRPGLELGWSSDWRCRLPRASFGPSARPILMVTLVVLVLLSAAGYAREAFLPDRAEATIQRHLGAVDTHLRSAEHSANRTIVFRELASASAALDLAVAAGADVDEVSAARARLTAAWDRAGGIIRLTGAVRIGGLPPVEDGGYQIVQSGDEIFLVGGALYSFDRGGQRLLRVLAPGDRLGDTVVGTLHSASLDDGSLVLTDGFVVYTRNLAADWAVRDLHPRDGEAAIWAAAPSAGYDGNLYLIDPVEGRILRFSGEDPNAPPHDWSVDDNRDLLRTVRDLVVDGRIHVLLDDGRVLSLYEGAVERSYDPPPGAAFLDPVALSSRGDGQGLYLVDGGDASTPGRVVRLDLETGETRELVADPVGGISPFLGLRDIVVDEDAGTAYVVTGDSLWRFSLPS